MVDYFHTWQKASKFLFSRNLTIYMYQDNHIKFRIKQCDPIHFRVITFRCFGAKAFRNTVYHEIWNKCGTSSLSKISFPLFCICMNILLFCLLGIANYLITQLQKFKKIDGYQIKSFISRFSYFKRLSLK